MNNAKQRAPHALVRLRIKLAWRHKRLRYLIGKPVVDHQFKLMAFSIMSAGLAVIARVISDIEFFGPAWTAGLVLMGSIVGMLVLVTLAHGWIKRHLVKFRSAKLLGLGVLALATFVAHGQAVGEVNSIFQIDASALPHVTTAASAMIIGTWLFWTVFLPVFVFSLICSIGLYVKSYYGELVIAFAIVLASGTWCALIGQQAVPEIRRKSNLYQIALQMDFNKRSHCADMPDGAEGVVFIGPDQRRAIVAPRKIIIKTRGKFGALVPQIDVPSDFKMVNCE
ncbi:MAG: hypothetical protein EOO38_32690 [Cytophagaceae bacterium]|nr:MAG: hypothetical protein EOO38_32690 [Cytophagaceae bacterium]